MAILAGLGAAAALASAGAGIAGVSSANRARQTSADIARAQMIADQNNQNYQRMVQAMVNNRAVAGTTDSFGTTVQYDPTTNTWVQKLGPLPLAADTAAINANMVRNTTDLANQELVNQVEMQRAAQAGPAADTAQRNLENFRPMSADTLTGLLTQQGIQAMRQAYDPLRQDTLSAMIRTGQNAGPALRQLGLGEADTLRKSLIDAQIGGLTNAGQINTNNLGNLINRASAARSLATPQLGQSGLGTSSADQLLNQLTNVKAQWAPTSTAGGMYGGNAAFGLGNQGAAMAASNVAPTGTGYQQIASGLKSLANFASDTGPNGAGALWDRIFGSNSIPMSTATNTNLSNDTGLGAMATATNRGGLY